MLLIIAGAGWWLWSAGYLARFMPPAQQSAQTETTPSDSTRTEQVSSGLPTGDTDTTDAALDQDIAALDAQLKGLADDSTSVSASLSDKPVTQSY